jgi:hypothetical protein
MIAEPHKGGRVPREAIETRIKCAQPLWPKVFTNILERKKSFVKPRKPLLDGVENDLEKMSVKCWRKITLPRDAWKLIVKDTMVLHGP